MTATNQGRAPHWIRPALAALAVLLIVVGAGGAIALGAGDGLAGLLGSDLFQTVAEEPAEDDAALTATVTVEDVQGALAELPGDLAISPDATGITCVVDGDGIWVEYPEAADASAVIDRAARRAAGLAQWAAQADPAISRVTWIAEDAGQTALFALALDPAAVVSDAADVSAADILAAATGYRIAGDAYASLDDSAFEQEAGAAPSLPDGSEVPVELAQTATDGADAAQGGASGSTGGGAAGAAQGGTSSAGSSQGGSTGTASGTTADLITVSITVDGSAAGAGASSATVSLAAGSTVYDALAKTGISISASGSAYGMYVSAIGGLAERQHGPMSGWVFSVNGVEPSVACSAYTLSAGDSIVWTYVNVEE
ncbi:DUF4430 domain-containing protein [Collinsella intestinalis]|uniref:DUF4430 domain-containing protein n=1 Tax=Collinsella intestinalis TaxID=147207 RepID=UPI0025A4C0ED|nr:DUF4430 domain-containing protein [Collinsella intestinalis]MDM8163910.1 DUF4430 domain-containing protein [Collinsella intestinalis]